MKITLITSNQSRHNYLINSLDKIWIENSNDIYTYYYGEFKKASNASITLNKLIKLGYKNIFILKKKNKNYVAAK